MCRKKCFFTNITNEYCINGCIVYVDKEIIYLSGSKCSSGESVCECSGNQCCEAGGGICACTSCETETNEEEDDDGIDWIEVAAKLLPIIYSI